MKFIIRATSDDLDLAENYEEVLKPFNYQIEEKIGWRGHEYSVAVATVEVNSLEEMLKLEEAVKTSIIISENEIEIYDAYRE